MADLGDISLTVTICDKCKIVLIATKDKRQFFTEEEKNIIRHIAELTNKKIRWEQRTIKDWAHCHLE